MIYPSEALMERSKFRCASNWLLKFEWLNNSTEIKRCIRIVRSVAGAAGA